MRTYSQLLVITLFYLWEINSSLLHHRLEKSINLYELFLLSSEIDIQKRTGYDERFTIDNAENESLLIEIVKNNERYRKLQYLKSIKDFPNETKIQIVKDFEDECDIHSISIKKGGLYNNWLLDKEIDG